MAKRILITGGSGFIGTNLVNFYMENDVKVLNIDLVEPVIASAKHLWKQVDLLKKNELLAVIEGFQPTHVIHLAARTDLGGKNIADYNVNTEGTMNLIDALSGIQGIQKIIFTSSMLVCKPGYIPKHDLDFAPATIYGESKRNMELMIRERKISTEWLLVRPTSIWGPWFQTPYRDFFDRVLSRRMYNIRGVACTKTYGFVFNTVYQLNKLLDAKAITNEVFYLGDQPALNISDWANHICDILKQKRPPEIPYWIFAVVAKFGDLINRTGLNFPMTSFRLQNMTTNNVLPLQNLYNVIGSAPYSEKDAIILTLDWINNNK